MKIDTGTEKLEAYTDGRGVGWMVFNRPERRNALSLEMISGASRALAALEDDPGVRVIVLKGAGDRAFVSGADIKEFETRLAGSESRDGFHGTWDEFWASWSLLSKPTIAMIRGYCLGGGVLLALEADIRICSDDSQFGVPAARLGVGYGYSGVTKLADVVGVSWAADILFSGRRLTASEALRAGLVTQSVPVAELGTVIETLASSIARNAPLTVAACKAALREMRRHEGERDLGRVSALVERCFESQDYLEGQRAFLEKREPLFVGR